VRAFPNASGECGMVQHDSPSDSSCATSLHPLYAFQQHRVAGVVVKWWPAYDAPRVAVAPNLGSALAEHEHDSPP
jgi:hypothetical protein